MRSAQAVYRPQSRNAAAPRKTQRTAVVREQNVAARPRRKQSRKRAKAPLPNGLSVMGLLVATLAVIGGMLVVSLNWQRSALALAQEEVALRSSLDHVADERQHLLIDERRASNPTFTSARAADAGLSEIKLDERTATAKPAAKTIKPATATNAVTHAAAKPLPALPKQQAKPAATTAKAMTTKPAITTVAIKVPQPIAQKTERAAIPAMPPSIAKTAGVKAALAR